MRNGKAQRDCSSETMQSRHAQAGKQAVCKINKNEGAHQPTRQDRAQAGKKLGCGSKSRELEQTRAGIPVVVSKCLLRENCEMRRKSEHQCTRFLSNKSVKTKFWGGLTGLHSKDQSFRGGRESAGSNFAEMSSAAL